MPTSPTATLLLAHHDRAAREALTEQLVLDGYDVLQASTAKNTIQTIDGYQPHVILLGTLEQPHTATDLLRALRADALPKISAKLPVITIGATDTVSVLRAYETGSDHHVAGDTDYITLRVILTAVIRRCGAAYVPKVLEDGALKVDVSRREVSIDGRVIPVPNREFEVLRALVAEPERVIPKHELMQSIWGYADVSATRTLDSHVCRLRNRLKVAGLDAVRNSWGQGYSLR